MAWTLSLGLVAMLVCGQPFPGHALTFPTPTTDTTTVVPTERECPTSFDLFRQQYLHCAPNEWISGKRLEDRRHNITGQDLVEGLEEFCSRLPTTRRCFLEPFEVCQEELVSVLNDAIDTTTWMCDDDNALRASVANALTAGDATVLEAETDVLHCTQPTGQDNHQQCVRQIMDQLPWIGETRSPGGMRVPISEFISHPEVSQFFPQLLECLRDRIRERCPSNALVMSFVEAHHVLFPPKIGVNVSEVIINAAAEENVVPTRRICPTSFYGFRRQYNMCSRDNWHSGLRLSRLDTLTGQDLVDGLEDFCSRLPTTRRCFLDPFEDCQEELVSVLNDVIDTTTWMCDDDNALRASVANALTAGNATVPASETFVANCTDAYQVHRCRRRTLEATDFLREMAANGRINIPINEFVSNPHVRQFFPDLLKCVRDFTREKCPHNTLVMSLAQIPDLIFPPKIGINASEMVLNAAMEESG